MKTSLKIKKITDGAVITAIYLVLLLTARFLFTGMEDSLFFILPVPMVIFVYRYDVKTALIPFIASSFLSFLLINPFNALFFIIPGIFVGLISGQMFKKDYSSKVCIFVITLASLIVNILTTTVFSKMLDYNIFEDILLLCSEIQDIIASISPSFVINALVSSIIIGLVPSILLIVSILDGIAVYLLSTFLLVRLKFKQLQVRFSFEKNNIPTFVGYLYILIFIGSIIILAFYKVEPQWLYILFNIELNIFILFSLLMIYQGVLFLADYSVLKGKKYLYFIGCLSILIFPLFMIVLGTIQNIFKIHQKMHIKVK